MANAYTHKVRDGKTTELRDFILLCATSLFGGREDLPLESREPSTYHRDRLSSCRRELSIAQARSDEEWVRLTDKFNREEKERKTRALEEKNLVRERYIVMLQKVDAWEPPSENHVDLKEFMRRQLRSSIEHDAPFSTAPSDPPYTMEVYKTDTLRWLKEDIEQHEKRWLEECEVVKQDNQWVRDLLESLP